MMMMMKKGIKESWADEPTNMGPGWMDGQITSLMYVGLLLCMQYCNTFLHCNFNNNYSNASGNIADSACSGHLWDQS